jgi:hypothetical protein
MPLCTCIFVETYLHRLLWYLTTMVTVAMSTFGILDAASEGYLQNLATGACSKGAVARGVWLRIARQYRSCSLVRGRGIFYRHY